MRWSLVAVLAASAVLASWGGAAAAGGLDTLVSAAGLERRFAEWPEANAGARERAEQRLDADTRALLLREVAAAFATPRIVAAVRARLSHELGDDAIRQLAAGYVASGAGGLLGPESGLAADDLRDFPRFASELSQQEVPAERFALVTRLDEGTRFGRDAWRVTTAWGAAIDRGARALRCGGPEAWRAPLPPERAAERRQLAEPFRERVQVELLFLARSVDTRDLRRAALFLETAPVRAFQEQVAQALDAALASSLGDLRQHLAPAVTARCP